MDSVFYIKDNQIVFFLLKYRGNNLWSMMIGKAILILIVFWKEIKKRNGMLKVGGEYETIQRL